MIQCLSNISIWLDSMTFDASNCLLGYAGCWVVGFVGLVVVAVVAVVFCWKQMRSSCAFTVRGPVDDRWHDSCFGTVGKQWLMKDGDNSKVNWKEGLYPPGPEFIDLVTIWVNNLWIVLVVAIVLLNSLLRALISKRFSLQKNIYQTALPLGCFHQEHVVHGFVWGCPLNIMGLFIQGVFEDLRCLLFKSCGW